MQNPTAWHQMTPEAIFTQFQSGPMGLNPQQADQVLHTIGPNQLPMGKRQSPLLRFLLQFHNILIYVLLSAAIITAILDHWVDTWVIVGVVLVNALIGFVQEGKAEKSLDAIRGLLNDAILVQRSGQRIMLPATQLVPGDVVVLQTGDKVPADLRLFETHDLRIDESLLTGESVPVTKRVEVCAPGEIPVADQTCIAFSGSLVTAGQGLGVVVATGARTQIGQISALLQDVKKLTTPLLQQMDQFAQTLTFAILTVSTATFGFGIWVKSYPMDEMFFAAVGLLVAAIPEGLPAIMTITLAIGVNHMAGRNAIIRRLPAVETLGSVSVICSDKTGTLTRNEMTVTQVIVPGHAFTLTGAGIDPHGDLRLADQSIQIGHYPALAELIRAALLCNDAQLHHAHGEWELIGDPTEGALVVMAHKAGLQPSHELEQTPRMDTLPFDSNKKYMATLHHNHNQQVFMYIKGAPEVLLPRCLNQIDGSPFMPADWEKIIATIAAQGQRTLAIARKTMSSDCQQLNERDAEQGFELLGIVGIIDPPREEAKVAIHECQAAGIRVKMITGDHALTAHAIGAQLGIGDGGRAISGPEIESSSDEELQTWVRHHDIFARVTPEHKLRLVQALQARGETIAMTGDGVNDAPALKQANIGIAMGKKGTEVAKEAAEMILADDNFVSIVNAVREGRVVYANIQKSILFILPTNGGEALTILGAIALGLAMPITPVQILWVNMVTAATLSLAFAFETSEANVMKQPPRNPGTPILTFELVMRVGFVSLLLVIASFGLFLWAQRQGMSLEAARTVAVNTLVLCECGYLFNVRHLLDPIKSWQDFTANRIALGAVALVIVLQLLFTYAPWMQSLFGTAAIGPTTWMAMLGASVGVFLLVELEKAVRRRVSS